MNKIALTGLVCGAIVLAFAGTAVAQGSSKSSAQKKAEAPASTVSLVYGVTRAGEVPFRNKPDSGADVMGYFPGQQAVWVVRPADDWVLVHYKNIAAWVAKTDLYAVFTLDPETKLPN